MLAIATSQSRALCCWDPSRFPKGRHQRHPCDQIIEDMTWSEIRGTKRGKGLLTYKRGFPASSSSSSTPPRHPNHLPSYHRHRHHHRHLQRQGSDQEDRWCRPARPRTQTRSLRTEFWSIVASFAKTGAESKQKVAILKYMFPQKVLYAGWLPFRVFIWRISKYRRSPRLSVRS